jgi:hypothetical protein
METCVTVDVMHNEHLGLLVWAIRVCQLLLSARNSYEFIRECHGNVPAQVRNVCQHS